MSRELLKLKNIGKLVPKSYRDCREYRWKQSWSKRSSNIALFSPSKEQTCRLMAEASSEKANSHAGNPWWFYTGSRPDQDGLSAEDTLDRPFVVYESLCFPSRDLEIPVSGLFRHKRKLKLLWGSLFEETAETDSVLYTLNKNTAGTWSWSNSMSYSLLHGASLATAMQRWIVKTWTPE